MPFPITETVAARQIRRGDIFTLHGHTRTADSPAWPSTAGHVHVRFVGGGDATLPEDYELVVSRIVETA